jgi:hypothetical protein
MCYHVSWVCEGFVFTCESDEVLEDVRFCRVYVGFAQEVVNLGAS